LVQLYDIKAIFEEIELSTTPIKTLNVFEFINYKKFLKEILKQNKTYRGLSKKLSEAAGCQPSYFSQVLNTKIQLVPDQGYGITHFLQFSADEKSYFMLLLEYERASTLGFKNHILTQLKSLQESYNKISKLLDRKKNQDNDFIPTYYSSWIYAYLHVLSSIPQFQKIENISAHLSMNKEQVLAYLIELEKANLITKENGLWKHSGQEWHLDRESPFINLHHFNWRSAAMADANNRQNNSTHFSGVYSISKSDYIMLHSKVNTFLKELNSFCSSSGTEEIVVFCLDLFSK
jgi:uncharacterized protein (TIGR02147 family)